MKILLVYYTGTYHTRYLTDRLARAFVDRGNVVERVEIARGVAAVCTEGYDLVGFGYPIYGFNSPLPFNRYVARMRIVRGQKFFIYKDSGETFAINNASSRILLRRMRRRGARCVGEYHFVMPYNIHFAFDRDFVREILAKNEKLLRILLYDLDHGTGERIRSRLIYNIASALVSIQKVGGAVNSFLYRVDRNACTQCGKCIRNCPQQNISQKKGKIRFGHHCDMCMRCSFYCPHNAIHIGFLEGWKVNGDYHLARLAVEGAPDRPYITEDSRGFYRCFVRHFAKIDARHRELFGE